MSEKNSQLMKTVQIQSKDAELRILPFFVAGLICFTIAVMLGSGSWLIFGSNNRSIAETVEKNIPTNNASQNENPAKFEVTADSSPTPAEFQPETPVKMELKGLVEVTGREVTIGGGNTKQPLERVIVNNFSIAETEVTNSQYAEFIKETNYRSPTGWKKNQFPKDSENFPVTNVSFNDAEEFCKWLGEKSGLPVRLPTEAEWELAARGNENNKYPWGNDWNPKNAVSKETGGKISAVKSFSLNRSPFGAYDMVGNVWEWTQEMVEKNDLVTDESVKEAIEKGQVLRVVKGGSALAYAKEISVQARYEIPEKTKVPIVGFRYVVEQKPKN